MSPTPAEEFSQRIVNLAVYGQNELMLIRDTWLGFGGDPVVSRAASYLYGAVVSQYQLWISELTNHFEVTVAGELHVRWSEDDREVSLKVVSTD